MRAVKRKGAMVICSGGIDSVTTAFYVKKKLKYPSMHILFFNYGQKALKQERACAKHTAKKLKAHFYEIQLPELSRLSLSLINKNGKSSNRISLKDTKKESKQWYVPARNTIFIGYALAYAESHFKGKKTDIYIGFKCEGKEHYPDTTKAYTNSVNQMLGEVSHNTISMKAPLITMDKEDIILLGEKLGVDFAKTWSCYWRGKKPCQACLACRLRKAGFYWAGREDSL